MMAEPPSASVRAETWCAGAAKKVASIQRVRARVSNGARLALVKVLLPVRGIEGIGSPVVGGPLAAPVGDASLAPSANPVL
jgi:hypothetical protein